MKIDGMVHCFFEQSGTFKNEFKKLGFDAFDYDILNDFGETDFIIDLFGEINKAYENKPSIFDKIAQQDLILAFFPCVRFEDQIIINFRGEAHQFKNWTDRQKLEADIKYMRELKELYELIAKLFVVCIDRGLMLIVENPYSTQHFLTRYFCLKPAIIDTDRTKNGDYYKKPTQYWFLNIQPKQNLVFEPLEYVRVRANWNKDKSKKMKPKEIGAKNSKVARSMIHPQYANRFIRQYLIDQSNEVSQ